MGTTMSVIKTLIVPAIISLILFLVSTYVALPLWRRWRSRYSQYLPLDTISTSTVSLRHRVQNAFARMMVPSTWRRNAHERLVIATDASEDGYSSEDGEELGEVGEDTRRALTEDARRDRHDSTRRLSRDLEEGFRDDSDDEDDGAGNRR
ncbi:hypothetical protein CABS01_08797 [Colletotrichum abscissum]|nr:uncharacterized protein CABS01_08797 [Colletotrichum abscissum]KAI3530576.1 hypothetical protein CABS02_14455 [Colletotrichum abscissum]KAK1505019.1 hypothetical protein CABS01_08797 [Colletotrichum abscissum]KAK1718538.1 hypothetical protein BDP67DRAFT_394725 [Colletotrichum lupini]